MNNLPKKILIIRTDRLGDVILSTPVITNLRRAFPDAHISFMCRPYTKDVLEKNPYLDEVIIYDKYGEHKNIFATVKFAFSLRKRKFDWAVILHPTNRAHIISFLAAIPTRAGWDRKASWLLTKKLAHKKQEGKKHELEYTLDILRALKVPIVDKTTYFPIKEEAEEKVKNLLIKEGLKEGKKFIVIHPCASCLSKKWPQGYFSELIKLLNEKTSLKTVIITAKGEEQFGKQLVNQAGVIDFRGKLTISEVGSLLRRAALFISNDSGPVHIAASLNTAVISIFGRKDPGLSPQRWKPRGKNSFYFHKDAGCTKCFAHRCPKKFLCLKKVYPEEVAEKALLLINKQYKKNKKH
ncbi:MAG: glycosyltransferase family 9 protein [Candidatus Omnitrophota bacterium]|nr:MAG: glycosyltransferase family 9 protein [Candidatus Omnitrophota bacterium]